MQPNEEQTDEEQPEEKDMATNQVEEDLVSGKRRVDPVTGLIESSEDSLGMDRD